MGVAEAQRKIDRWELMHWVAYFRLQDEESKRGGANDFSPPPARPRQASVEKMQNVFKRLGLFKEK